MSVSRAVQRRLGLALRSRVAGDDAPERAQRIWGAEGERWFTPEDPIWRVNADASMFPGGLAALLLQSLHPSAMAGVAGHSGYKGDPWGRLQRTSHYLAVTTFGTVADAEQAIAHVRSRHRVVRGVDDRGRPYAADDPHLLRWVHVAEIWSFLTAFQSYAATPLTDDEADLYVHQTTRAASLLGATDLPHTVEELDQVIARLPTRAREHAGRPRGHPLHAAQPARPADAATRLRTDRGRRGRTASRLGQALAPAAVGRSRPRRRQPGRLGLGRPGAVGDGRPRRPSTGGRRDDDASAIR